jgi:cell wall-associated NlpC family hydrolase
VNSDTITIPDINHFIQPLLGTPYRPRFCWDLARSLIHQAFGIALEDDPSHANAHFAEIWYRGDARDPLTLVQPWDAYIMLENDALPISTHVGLVVDTLTFVHARNNETGVSVERLRRWKPKLLQIARLRRLL